MATQSVKCRPLFLRSIVLHEFYERARSESCRTSRAQRLVAPFLAAFVYLITRGKGMAERQNAATAAARDAANSFIREAAGTGPASEIAQAKPLLDAGTISADEYSKLKAKALA